MIWPLRAVFAAAIVLLVVLATRAQPERPVEQAAAVPTIPPTTPPRPTATPELVVSRMARTTPTPLPRTRNADASQPSVAVFDNGYGPAALRVRVGQSVSWRNDGALGHDISGMGSEAWASGPLGMGQTYSRVFASPGQYDYSCSLHPTMQGRVVVEP